VDPASPAGFPTPAPALPSWPPPNGSGPAGFPQAGYQQPGGPGPGQPFPDQSAFDAFGPISGGSPAAQAGYGVPAPAPLSAHPGQPGGSGHPGQPGGSGHPGQPGGEAEHAPQIRNGRVLLAVLCAAVLLLVVPLGIVWLATRSSGPSFDVGSCVRRSGTEAVAADCSAADAFTVVKKVDNQDKCTDPPGQPFVVVTDGGKDNVLCLRPAASR
jgi:hypothetical protein